MAAGAASAAPGMFSSQAEAATITAPPSSQFASSGCRIASTTRIRMATPMLAPTVHNRDDDIGATGEGEIS